MTYDKEDFSPLLVAIDDYECELLISAGEPKEVSEILHSFDYLPPDERRRKRRLLLEVIRYYRQSIHSTSSEPTHGLRDDGESTEALPLYDPDYSPALTALKEDGNASPIARLLKQCLPMPVWVGKDLGIMLDPSAEYRGVKLVVKSNTGKRWRELLKTLIAKRDAGNRFRELLEDGGGYEYAVAQVMQETGKSKGWVVESSKVDNAYIVRVSQGWLGYDDPDVRDDPTT